MTMRFSFFSGTPKMADQRQRPNSHWAQVSLSIHGVDHTAGVQNSEEKKLGRSYIGGSPSVEFVTPVFVGLQGSQRVKSQQDDV